MSFRTIEKAKNFCLQTLIEYKQNRIISLTLCNDSDIKIVLFSLDRQEAITEEQTPNIEHFQLLEGEMEISVEGKKAYLYPGESIVINPQEEHSLLAIKPSKMLQTSIKQQEDFMERFINHMPIGEVFEMQQQIEYEENKVASITLVQKPNLIITLFSLYEGEEIGGHSSKGDAMVSILDGCAQIQIGENTHIVEKGESIIMPANVVHALKAKTSFKMLLTVVKPL